MEEKECFNNKKILNILNNFKLHKDGLEVNVMFVNSSFTRNKKYRGYTLLTDNQDILPTVIDSIEYLNDEISKRSFEKYDLELSMDDIVQVVENKKVINGFELLSVMNESINDNDKILDENVRFDTLNFTVIQLYDSIEKKIMYIFKKYVHPTSRYKSTLKYTLHGKKASPFKKDVLTINSLVDAILYEENYYILNRKNFNTIFNFKDFFYKIIEDNKSMIKESNLFEESSEFIKDCTVDGRHLPRLTKVILAKGFEMVTENRIKLVELKAQYRLSFQLTDDNRIRYSNKKEIPDIIDVLLDHFVISALTDKKC